MGADGAASKVRELAGVKTSRRDYHQRGLVATVEVSRPNSTAWQRFLPTGPFALLPVRNGYFNIVWSVTEEVAKAVESANEQAAIQAFNEVRSPIPVRDQHLSDRPCTEDTVARLRPRRLLIWMHFAIRLESRRSQGVCLDLFLSEGNWQTSKK